MIPVLAFFNVHTLTSIAIQPWLAALFGAAIGSFLNVVIVRLPRGESVVLPGSHCACGHPIAFYDNIPGLSWFFLRGRARCCGRAFSFRYPLVEIFTAGCFALCASHWTLLKAFEGCVYVCLLVVAAGIDWDTLEIPDRCSMGLFALAIVSAIFFPFLHGVYGPWSLVTVVTAVWITAWPAFVCSGVLFWLSQVSERLLKKEALGLGDVKLVGGIAAMTGLPGGFFSVVGGACLGIAHAAAVGAWRKLLPSRPCPFAPNNQEAANAEAAEADLRDAIPFGPFIAIAGIIYLLFSDRLAALFPILSAVTPR